MLRLTSVCDKATIYFDLEDGVWSATALVDGGKKKYVNPDINDELKKIAGTIDPPLVARKVDLNIHKKYSIVVEDNCLIVKFFKDIKYIIDQELEENGQYAGTRKDIFLYKGDIIKAAKLKKKPASDEPLPPPPDYYSEEGAKKSCCIL